MRQALLHVALVVKDYDEAIDFFCRRLHFDLLEDTYQPEQDKRWVVVSPPGSTGASILLALASKPEQEPFVGRQTGGRVFLFLQTDDFWRDFKEMREAEIAFVRSGQPGVWLQRDTSVGWPDGSSRGRWVAEIGYDYLFEV